MVQSEKDNHESGVSWFLVGNKFDLDPSVDLNEAQEYAEANSLQFVHTSAKSGLNIIFLFEMIAFQISRSTLMPKEDIQSLSFTARKDGDAKKKYCK